MIQILRFLSFFSIAFLLSSAELRSQCSFPFTENFESGTAGQNEFPISNAFNFNCITYEVNGSGGVALEEIDWMGFTSLQNFSGLMVVGDFLWTGAPVNGVNSFTMRATNNTNDFKLNSLDWAVPNSGSPTTFTITGYNNGVQIAQITGVDVTRVIATNYGAATADQINTTYIGPGDGSGYALHLDFIGTGWQNIDAVVFTATGSDITMALDNISFAPPVTDACTQLVEADIPLSNTGPFTKTISSQVFTFTPAANSQVYILPDFGFEGLYAYDEETSAGTEITISAPTGYSFDLNSFRYFSDIFDANDLTLTLTFANGSTDTKTYALIGGGSAQTFNSFTTAANDVVSVRLVTNTYVLTNDFCIDDVKAISSLPLTLLSFAGTATNHGAQLVWKTSQEVNTESFEIQRSQNGSGFTAIATVPSNALGGNYTYTDQSAVTGRTYLYRLKMNDADGRYTYSPTTQVRMNKAISNEKFTLFPNPVVGNQVSLRANVSNIPAVQVVVKDITGRNWLNKTILKANELYSFSVQHLPGGTYVLQVYNLQGELLHSGKFIK